VNESFARRLREAREARGLSRRELAREARVPVSVVKNLEEGNWSALPEDVYLRWFMERLAQVLDIPPGEWCPLVDGLEPRVDLSSVEVKRIAPYEGWGRWHAVALCLFLMVLVGAFLWFGVGTYLTPRKLGLSETRRVARTKASEKGKETTESKILPLGIGVASSRLAREGGEAEAALVKIHRLELRAKDLCWVKMVLEGGAVRDFILRPGERYRVSFTRAVKMRLGNSGAVEMILDGEPLEFPGEGGAPKDVRVTPSGVELVAKDRN